MATDLWSKEISLGDRLILCEWCEVVSIEQETGHAVNYLTGEREMAECAERDARRKTEHQQRVESFMRLAGQEIPDKPTIPSEEVRLLRARLILEEALETIEALGCRVGLDFGIDDDVLADHSKYKIVRCGVPDLEQIADGVADISVVSIGTLSACGIADDPILREVDESNLRKFCAGGRLRDDGKWIKPTGWEPPKIAERLREQGG